jgi:ABC-type phosphate transport system substrate-binding protein
MTDEQNYYPEGAELDEQIQKRHRGGTFWRTLFQASTIIGILALTALLYNIINETFGTVAVQNRVEPDKLILDLAEDRILNAPNTDSSENDNILVDSLDDDPYGISFFGYAYYTENSDRLKLLQVDGVEATAENVANGLYPLSRFLYMYTTEEVLLENQAASIYLNYLLTNINREIGEIGYFPVSDSTLSASQIAWVQNSGFDLQPGQWATISPAGLEGNVNIAGSSTVFPVADAFADLIAAEGFAANVDVQSVGSTAGFRAFCVDETADIATASRPIQPGEYQTCRDNFLRPIELRIGIDALAVVVSEENDFLTDITPDELALIFTTAENWSDVNPAWPDQPINRYIPGADSGTLDFFVETIFPAELETLSRETLIQILQANITVGRGRNLERQQRFFADGFAFDDPDLFNEACAGEDPPTGCTRRVRDLENVYALVNQEIVQPDVMQAWTLVESIFNQEEIAAITAEEYPYAELEFRSWLTPEFLVTPQSSTPEFAGVRTAILGSLWVVAITILFSSRWGSRRRFTWKSMRLRTG